MHNIVIDQARLRRRQVPQVRLAAQHDDSDPRSADPASAVELRPVLLDALRTLAPQQRMIVVLRYFDDRSENEVAGLLGVSTGTVKKRGLPRHGAPARTARHQRAARADETDTTVQRIGALPETDEDILRQLMIRSTDDLFAPPAAATAAIRRQRRHRLRTRVIGGAGTAAAAGVAVGVLVSSGPGPRPARASGRSSGTKSATVTIRLAAPADAAQPERRRGRDAAAVGPLRRPGRGHGSPPTSIRPGRRPPAGACSSTR